MKIEAKQADLLISLFNNDNLFYILGFPTGKESRCNLSATQASYHYVPSLYYKITLLIVGQLTYNQKRHKITLRVSKFDCYIEGPIKHCIKYEIHIVGFEFSQRMACITEFM